MRTLVVWMLVFAWGSAQAWGESGPAANKSVTAAEYRVELQRLRGVVQGCEQDAKRCDSGLILSNLHVEDEGFDANWEWLRGILDGAKKAKADDRKRLMAEAEVRLDLETQEARGGAAVRGVEFARARRGADEVLARREFRLVTEAAYWERFLARLGRWMERLFSGAVGLGRYAAWIGPALEWGFVLAAAVGAAVWGLRVMRRQRLAIAMGAPGKMREWEEASRRWAEMAKAQAENGDWREAVHSLYWACVVELEGRKVWRQTRERTPREYLRLLEAGSPYVEPVGAMTQLLERIWYGLGVADRGDYDRALGFYEEVRAA